VEILAMKRERDLARNLDLGALALVAAVISNRIPTFSERPTRVLAADVLKAMPGYRPEKG
jgi:hypothetical protein